MWTVCTSKCLKDSWRYLFLRAEIFTCLLHNIWNSDLLTEKSILKYRHTFCSKALIQSMHSSVKDTSFKKCLSYTSEFFLLSEAVTTFKINTI